jgi:tetratricopeptide (TPR) repeat protein
VELWPGNPLAHLWLGEALLDRGRKDEAREHLEKVLSLPPPADDPADEGVDERARAQQLLGRM